MARRILVVDDEPQIRTVLRAYLEADGFQVAECATGAEALPGDASRRARGARSRMPVSSRRPSWPAAATNSTPPGPSCSICSGGWRSSVGASLLRSQGFSDVSDVMGGYGAWALVHAVAS